MSISAVFFSILNFFRFIFFRINLFVFILFSAILTLVAEKLPHSCFNYKRWLYRERKWEHGGRLYDHLFAVRKWKSCLPEVSDFIKAIFPKKHLAKSDFDYLNAFLLETCKAELTHWLIIGSSFLFVFWSGIFTSLKVFLFASVLNLPYIIIQRYNRPRIIRLLKKNDYQHYELAPAKA